MFDSGHESKGFLKKSFSFKTILIEIIVFSFQKLESSILIFTKIIYLQN